MSTLGEFGSAANNVSRNPLGIVALFIVLLYGIAGLVLGTSADNFAPSERLPLIWFLVLFPVAVLAVFAWLVSRHHQKLYAPADYKTDDAFLKTLTPEAQRRRLEQEVSQIGAIDAEPAPAKSAVEPSGPMSVREAVPPEVQFKPVRDFEMYRTETVLAEDFVLRQLEVECGIPIRRQAALRRGNREIQLAGLMLKEGKPVGIDVMLMREGRFGNNLNNRAREMGGKAAQLAALGGVALIVAVVGVGLSEKSRRLISERFTVVIEGTKIPVELKWYDLDELQKLFGVTKIA